MEFLLLLSDFLIFLLPLVLQLALQLLLARLQEQFGLRVSGGESILR